MAQGRARPPQRNRALRRPAGVAVLLADPDPLAISVLAAALSRDRSVGQVGEAYSPQDAIAAAGNAGNHFDVAIVSEWFPGPLGGIDLTRELHRVAPALLIMLLAIPSQPHDVLAAIRAGARGYLLKERDMSHLPRVVRRAVTRGIGEFSSPLTDLLLSELSAQRGAEVPGAVLTERESDVVHLVGKGLSNRDIAEQLGLSVATVKTHVHSAMRKHNVHNRVQLALLPEE